MTRRTLDELALAHDTDKSSRVHDYARTYDRHFAGMRDSVRTVLELGVYGGASLRMFRDYFERATVHGLDSNARRATSGERIKFWHGDQADETLLARIVEDCGGSIDLVVDDAAHTNVAQWSSFRLLWKHVSPGGVYVVEDTCCSYWPEYQNSFPPNDESTISRLLALVHDVNFRGYRSDDKATRGAKTLLDGLARHGTPPSLEGMLDDVDEIAFANGTTLLRKRGELAGGEP